MKTFKTSSYSFITMPLFNNFYYYHFNKLIRYRSLKTCEIFDYKIYIEDMIMEDNKFIN